MVAACFTILVKSDLNVFVYFFPPLVLSTGNTFWISKHWAQQYMWCMINEVNCVMSPFVF